jgi:DNA repair protein REV1
MAEEDSDVPQDMMPEGSEVTDEDPTCDTYGASRFGGFGDYMRRKRAKLQIQNAQMSENNNDNASGEIESRIFQGIAIYVRFLELPRLPEGC